MEGSLKIREGKKRRRLREVSLVLDVSYAMTWRGLEKTPSLKKKSKKGSDARLMQLMKLADTAVSGRLGGALETHE